MFVWKIRLYKSRGEVVGGDLISGAKRALKSMARGKKEGLGIWPYFLGNIHNLVNHSSQTFLVLSESLYFFIRPSTQAQLLITYSSANGIT